MTSCLLANLQFLGWYGWFKKVVGRIYTESSTVFNHTRPAGAFRYDCNGEGMSISMAAPPEQKQRSTAGTRAGRRLVATMCWRWDALHNTLVHYNEVAHAFRFAMDAMHYHLMMKGIQGPKTLKLRGFTSRWRNCCCRLPELLLLSDRGLRLWLLFWWLWFLFDFSLKWHPSNRNPFHYGYGMLWLCHSRCTGVALFSVQYFRDVSDCQWFLFNSILFKIALTKMQVPAGYLEAADGRMVGRFYPHASPMLRMFETTNQLKYVENS